MGCASALSGLLAIVSVAGCADDPVPRTSAAALGSVAQSPARLATRPAATLADMAGEWDIVSFDDYSPARLDGDGKRHAYVDVGERGLRFAIGCNHSNMAGRIENGVLYPAPVDDGLQTVMGCGPERGKREADFFGFLRSEPRVGRTADGRVRMTSAKHRLVLERSSVRRLANGPTLSEITGSWRVVSFTRFRDGGYQGWGAMYAPGRLRIGGGTLSYSRCPAASVRFAYTSDFALKRVVADAPAAAVACSASDPATTEVEPLLAALLGQSPEAERVTDTRFVLRSRDHFVLLTGEAEYRREIGE